jgi:hypothetical protein
MGLFFHLKNSKTAMNVKLNKKERSCHHCCSGKAMSVTYYECVFVALGIHHAMRMLHIVTCGLPCSTVVSHIIS